MRELIKAKEEQRPPREIEEAAPVSNVINLMDALKRSVGKGGGDKGSVTRPVRQGIGTTKAKASARGKAKTPQATGAQDQKREGQEREDRQEDQPPQGGVTGLNSMPRGSLRDYHAKRDFARTG